VTHFGALERLEVLAAALAGLWIGAMFLPWFGAAGTDGGTTSGWGVIDSSWLPLTIVAVASVLLLLDALGVDGLGSLPVPALSTFLLPVGLFFTALFMLAADTIAYGGWTALGLSAGAVVLSAMAWITDRRG
jgi:hypothetical protein